MVWVPVAETMREGCAVKINTKGWGLRNYNDYFNIQLTFNQPLMEEYPVDGWPLKSFCEVKISTKVSLQKGLFPDSWPGAEK